MNIIEACKFIDYCPITGNIKHKLRRNSDGSLDKDGYLILKIKGKQFKAHRLAWTFYYGKEPNGVIDHINRIKTDNRIENLRDTTQQINILNTVRYPNKETGEIGIYIDKTSGLNKKYALKKNKKTYRFYTLEEALSFKNSN